MRAKDIYQQALEYPEGVTPWPPSDADYYTMVAKMTLADKDVDFYSLGVLMRLYLLCYYSHPWQELYKYGGKENVDKALQKLEKAGYLRLEDDKLFLI